MIEQQNSFTISGVFTNCKYGLFELFSEILKERKNSIFSIHNTKKDRVFTGIIMIITFFQMIGFIFDPNVF